LGNIESDEQEEEEEWGKNKISAATYRLKIVIER